MKVGLDTDTLSGLKLTAFEALAFAGEHDLDGLQFGSAHSLSRTLDLGALREVREEADRLELYLEVGVSTVNPHRFPTTVTTIALGDGDYRRGVERLIHAARSIGSTELHSTIGHLGDRVATAQWVRHNDGRGQLVREQYVDARLNPPVPWGQQIRDTTEFLRGLGPLLRDLGCRINIETHADVTTFELVRMVEEVGNDVLGITLDIANTVNQLEDPASAARRATPYVHGTHTKDGLLFFAERGLAWQPRACGSGSIPWELLLPILGEHAPDLTLSIEDHKWTDELPIDDPDFLAAHPDLTPPELATLVRMARIGQGRISRGETPEPDADELVPWADHQIARIDAARGYLKGVLGRLGLLSAQPR